MSKRTSGLGRGLGDLLADNSPEIRGGATVVRRDENGEATITPDIADVVETAADVAAVVENVGGEAVDVEQVDSEKEPQTPSRDAEPIIINAGLSAGEAIFENANSEAVRQAETSEEIHHPHRSLKALFRNYK